VDIVTVKNRNSEDSQVYKGVITSLTRYTFLGPVTHTERIHTQSSQNLEFLVFLCPVFDLSVGVQTAARASIVSLFSGDPQGGKRC